jgi:endogenous inhibitor of DNA gyrase (YacG/DUF329 family)
MSADENQNREPARLVKCPTCRKQSKFTPGNPYRPFCSERCKMIDLGAWAEEKYAIPTGRADPSIDPTGAPLDTSDEDEDGGY